MDDYPKTRSDRYWFIIIATVVLFYVTPTVCISIYTIVSPRTAVFGNKSLVSYDSYVTDLLRDLSERDYAQHTDYGDEKRLGSFMQLTNVIFLQPPLMRPNII